MRRIYMCVCSTAHLPADDRDAIEALIARAPRRRGRLVVEHPDLSIEAHQYGFAAHLGIFDDHIERPESVSPEFWRLLEHAHRSGARWIWFDCDEPPTDGLPVFEDDVP